MPRRGVTTAVEGLQVKRRTIQKKVNVNELTPDEILHKQNLAVFLRAATYTNTQIADALGVSVGTVRKWFKDKRVLKLYDETLVSLSTAAKQFLETLTIQAVKRLGELINEPDPTVALNAIREVLDRGGLPKLSRTEKEEKHTHTGNEKPQQLEVRITSAADADRYEQLVAEAESITAGAAEEKK